MLFDPRAGRAKPVQSDKHIHNHKHTACDQTGSLLKGRDIISSLLSSMLLNAMKDKSMKTMISMILPNFFRYMPFFPIEHRRSSSCSASAAAAAAGAAAAAVSDRDL